MRPTNPADPRRHAKHRERGPRAFRYTYDDVAEAAGVGAGTVRTYASAGRVDPGSLAGVLTFVLGRRSRRRVQDDELARVLGGEEAAARWRRRWPRFALFWCARAGCDAAQLAPGLCPEHGGGPPALRFGAGGDVELRGARGYVPFRSVVAGARPDRVRCRDGNPWNNRPDNLLVERRGRACRLVAAPASSKKVPAAAAAVAAR